MYVPSNLKAHWQRGTRPIALTLKEKLYVPALLLPTGLRLTLVMNSRLPLPPLVKRQSPPKESEAGPRAMAKSGRNPGGLVSTLRLRPPSNPEIARRKPSKASANTLVFEYPPE